MVQHAFELSEQFDTPVILRLTTRICHVKAVVSPGERRENEVAGIEKDMAKYVMVPGNAKKRIPVMFERLEELRRHSEASELNYLHPGSDQRVGFITSGPTFLHVLESCPNAPALKLGLSHRRPSVKGRALSQWEVRLVVVE